MLDREVGAGVGALNRLPLSPVLFAGLVLASEASAVEPNGKVVDQMVAECDLTIIGRAKALSNFNATANQLAQLRGIVGIKSLVDATLTWRTGALELDHECGEVGKKYLLLPRH